MYPSKSALLREYPHKKNKFLIQEKSQMTKTPKLNFNKIQINFN